MPQHQLVALRVDVLHHRRRIVELLRVEFVIVIGRLPRRIDQDHARRQSQLAVLVDVFLHLRLVLVVVARLPRRKRPVRRQHRASGLRGKPLQNPGKLRPGKQHNAQLRRRHIDDDFVLVARVQVERCLAGGIHPQPVAAGAHEERNRLVAGRAFHALVIGRQVLDHRMRVVQRVEALAQPEVAGRVAHREAPVADLPGNAGDLHHARRNLAQMHLVGGHRIAVEGEVVQQQLRAGRLSRQREPHRVRPAPLQAGDRNLGRAHHPRRPGQLLAAHVLRRRAMSRSQRNSQCGDCHPLAQHPKSLRRGVRTTAIPP